uniref:Uncharacterized protein n=1 Tax=Pavo cristatus TaxID=9049 RepID=A0A8C9FR35_PAVCR
GDRFPSAREPLELLALCSRHEHYENHLHRAGAHHRRAVHRWQCPGVLGCGHQQHLEERDQLFPGVSGGGRHRRGFAGHPFRHHHQHRLPGGFSQLPLLCLLRAGADPKLHLQPAGGGHRPVPGHQDPPEVRDPAPGSCPIPPRSWELPVSHVTVRSAAQR